MSATAEIEPSHNSDDVRGTASPSAANAVVTKSAAAQAEASKRPVNRPAGGYDLIGVMERTFLVAEAVMIVNA